MSLTSLFNFKYLKENIKKSKAIILLCIFLVPVINVICYLMKTDNGESFVPSMFEVSMLSSLGMYVIPLIISITLFGFVYKRKSSDFVMSFPVTKKQIFLSNTLGGILIIVIMNLLNLVLILISSIFITNVFMNYRMLFDTFLIWTISYIFVFMGTNIAVSLSANKITTVVVTLLVLFLVPFVHTFIFFDSFRGNTPTIYTKCESEECKPRIYECNDDKRCEKNLENNIYMYNSYIDAMDTDYTIPYYLIVSDFAGIDNYTYDTSSVLLKMVFISILYVIMGIILFDRKKFEIVGTSFKSERVHIFVRSLTLFPILCICYVIIKHIDNYFITYLLLFVLVFAYIIIYDLVTRKKIVNVFKSLASLIIMGIIVVFIGEISDVSKNEAVILDVKDINKLTILEDMMEGSTYNKDIINYVMSIGMETGNNSEYINGIDMEVKVKNRNYKFTVMFTKQQYDKFMNLLKSDSTYVKTSKINSTDGVFAIKLGNNLYITSSSPLYKEIVSRYPKSGEFNMGKLDTDSSIFDVELCLYDDFSVKHTLFNVQNDKELMEKFVNYHNELMEKALTEDNFRIDLFYVNTGSNDIYYQYKYAGEIYDFIKKNIKEKVNVSEPFAYISLNYTSDLSHYKTAVFVTNRVDELKEILKKFDYEDETFYQNYRAYSADTDQVM